MIDRRQKRCHEIPSLRRRKENCTDGSFKWLTTTKGTKSRILTEWRNIENLFANDQSCHVFESLSSVIINTQSQRLFIFRYTLKIKIPRYVKCIIFNSRLSGYNDIHIIIRLNNTHIIIRLNDIHIIFHNFLKLDFQNSVKD